MMTRWPRKAVDKELVLTHLLRHFETDRRYSEKEVNEVLKELHTIDDWALLQRRCVHRQGSARYPFRISVLLIV